MLVTVRRNFGIVNSAYFHSVRWVPAEGTRLIVQRIVRTTKKKTWGRHVLDGDRVEYWELWEVVNRRVYPATNGAEEASARRYYLPQGTVRGSEKAGVTFAVPDPPTGAPFLGLSEGALLFASPTADAAMNTCVHDVFSVNFAGTGTGTFKVHGEVYELTLAHLANQELRTWLNAFRPNLPLEHGHTAGVLPAWKDATAAPRDMPVAPSVLRYEAGTFDSSRRTAANRRFPSKAEKVRFLPVGVVEVNTITP